MHAEELLARADKKAGEQRRIPESTYRLQFHAGFTFRDAAAIVPYLYELGVTHCYASPYLKAKPGSTHGYDVIDHCSLNPEVGMEADHRAWVDALRKHGMGHILDTVPNHVGVATNDNTWWNNVLEHGPASAYATYFDIAWELSPRPELHDKVLLPVLGAHYADVLEKGELRLTLERGSFFIKYYDRRFPVDPRSYRHILRHRLEHLHQTHSESNAIAEYQSILLSIEHLPTRSEREAARAAARSRETAVIKRRLASLYERDVSICQFIDENIRTFNGHPGDPASYDLLDRLLEDQCYRLSYWEVAADEINYRRFFDVNELAALKMERREVFEATHRFTLQLLSAGLVDGLRIDHPDGLYDPQQYFQWLQQGYVLECARRVHEESGAESAVLWQTLQAQLLARLGEVRPRRLYVLAEKILAMDEPLPVDWPIAGTSGYDLLNMINGLFVDPANEEAFTSLYEQWTGDLTSFEDVAYQKKKLVLDISLASELHMLAQQLDRLAQKDRRSRDFTHIALRHALREMIACFPVYRTYISTPGAGESDVQHIESATRRAIERNPKTDQAIFHFVRDVLLQRMPRCTSESDRAQRLRLAGKFQQLTAPATAKGIEDTSFYVYHRLISLNEVGGDPAQFGVEPAALHQYFSHRAAHWPHALSALSTHDTKRSEDVRARINVLSEMPEEWRSCVTRWSELNAPHRRAVGGLAVPAPDEEYLLYQTLIGAWPLEEEPGDGFCKRIQAYMQKAMREAKLRTSWTHPNSGHEQAVQDFIAAILDSGRGKAFLDSFRPFHKRISRLGMLNSLAQTLLRMCCPGVPDIYQGTETWDLSLVDPDNRRPVDYSKRREMLRQIRDADSNDPTALLRDAMEQKENGLIKLLVTWRTLCFRRSNPDLMSAGSYLPLRISGPREKHLFAFARGQGDRSAICVVSRLLNSLAGPDGVLPNTNSLWQQTVIHLPDEMTSSSFSNLFTSAKVTVSRSSISVAEAFAHMPFALIVSSTCARPS